MSDDAITINLKSIRNAAGLSLSATQDLTGVSKAMLGQIERGESSPTIATLWKLAKGFHLPLTAFIQDPSQSDEDEDTHQFRESITVQTLLPHDQALGCESFLVSLAAGQTHNSAPHDTAVIEDVFAVQGSVDVFCDGEWYPLAVGEAKRFAADQPHGYRAASGGGARFINTIHYPKK